MFKTDYTASKKIALYSFIMSVSMLLLMPVMAETPDVFQCKVTKVIDGDTFECSYQTKVRLYEYDAPELRDTDKHKKAAAYHAKADMIEKILNETLVCHKKGKSGKRIVAQCFLNNQDIVER